MKTKKLFFALITAASVMLFNSCSDEDPCDGVTCSGKGTPTEAAGICTCDCDEGYSGDNCETEDKCITENVECGDHGTCNDGTCDCDAGYEGDSCEIVSRDKFIGGTNNNFLVTDTCATTPYNVTITTSATGIDKIIINDFGVFLCNGDAPDVIASVSGDDLTIASQTFCQGNEIIISGSGSISGDAITITVNYDASNGGNSFTCLATLVRQ